MRFRLVAFASLVLVVTAGCGGAYGSLGMAEDGSGTGDGGQEGAPDTSGGEPTPDVPAEDPCKVQALSVVFEMTVDEGPDSFGDAVAVVDDAILVGSVANHGPALTRLTGDGAPVWSLAWPEYEGERVRVALDQSGASVIYAGLVDGNLTALFDPDGEQVWERVVPETGYDFHPAAVGFYSTSDKPFEEQVPGVRRAAWRTYMDEPSVGLFGRYDNPYGSDLWDLVIEKDAPVRIEDLVIARFEYGSTDGEMPIPDQVVVGAEGDAPWIAAYAVDEGRNFEIVPDTGAASMFTAAASAPDLTAIAGGICEVGGQRWGWLVRTDGSGSGLEDATGACPTWAPLDLPPVADLTVTNDGTAIVISHESDAIALVRSGQAPDLVSLSALLGHDVAPRAVAASGTCDFVVTGRVESDGSSFVARVSGE